MSAGLRVTLASPCNASAGRRANPERHRVAPIVLSVISAVGVPFWAWGLIVVDPWITAVGVAIQMLGKLWFLDRMALLYDDVHGSCAPVVNRPE